MPLKAMVVDPNPAKLRKVPLPEYFSADPAMASSSFAITYVDEGGADLWSEPCATFPAAARDVFQAAAAVWANILHSAVPITIRACWATMESDFVLGYSGGGTLHANFAGNTRANTYFSGSLANALAGTDLQPANADMHITYNSKFSWYYGSDGNTPPDQYDLFSVVLHEIGHGLNFSGSMTVSDGQGWMYHGFPTIYDVFMRDASGTPLINYATPSAELAAALTSNNVYFHGPAASAANGDGRVKMYAPAAWAPGSSYSHLDYATFNNTANQLMVYAIGSGEAIHDPGAVTIGLLQDLGWSIGSSCTEPPSPPGSISYPSLAEEGEEVGISWAAVAGAAAYQVQRATDPSFSDATTVHDDAATSLTDILDAGTYHYRVRSSNDCGSSEYLAGGSLTVAAPCSLPDTPGSISYPSSADEGEVVITWAPVTGATAYQVQRATGSSFSDAVTIHSGGATSFTDTLGAGTYYYRVRAESACGTSDYRQGGALVVIASCVEAPASPSSISYPSSAEEGIVMITWSTVKGAASYRLQRAPSSSFSDAVTVYDGGPAFFTDHLAAGKYFYRIRATNSCGSSGYLVGSELTVTVGTSFPWTLFLPAVIGR